MAKPSESESMLYRYLLGAMPQIQAATTVRYYGTDEEVARIPEIVASWRRASTRMQELARAEAGVADAIAIGEMPTELQAELERIASDPLFAASFSDVPTGFAVVEIDRMVAPQREVNLDYVESLKGRLTKTDLQHLIEFCLAPRAAPPEIKVLQTAQNQLTFSSRSLDLRFLGGFPKQITEDDIRAAHMGGQPVEVITLLVGFGAAPINGWLVGRRFILANGFHRTVALRSAGVTHIPVVVRQVANPDIEFPDQYLGLSRNYLTQHPRPALVRDFFERELILEVRLKPRKKVLRVAWAPDDSIVPE